LVDLDGVVTEGPRRRVISILAFNEEQIVARELFSIPAAAQEIVAVNLKDFRFGIYQFLQGRITHHGITKGRVYIRLPPEEHHASLLVNEFEPLLMQDLIEVLRDPVRFVTKDHHMFTNGWRHIEKQVEHLKYNSAGFLSQDFGRCRSSKLLPEMNFSGMNMFPAYRIPGMKRSITLLVSDQQVPGRGVIVDGAFQYPIMMQWANGSSSPRKIEVLLTRFV
jgi:hypothetical protein